MTATRDPDRRLRAWLDLMPDEAPDRVIASVLQATSATPQVRVMPWHGRGRAQMNRLTLIAATALVAVALIGGAALLSTGGPGPTVPSPIPHPTPTAAPPDSVSPFPQQVWGDWLAETEVVPGLTSVAQQVQLSINGDGGLTAWLQLNGEDGRFVAESSSMSANAGELRFRSDPGSSGCTFGDDGTYEWARSADGLFLTLTMLDDECEGRGTALNRTWVRSLGAVHDGGPGVLSSTSPMTQVTLPRGQQLAANAGTSWQEIKTFGDAQPFQAFVVIANPGGFGAPCSTTDPDPQPIEPTTSAFIEYMEAVPGATLTTEPTEIDGRPAIQFDYRIDSAVECESGDISVLHPEDPSDSTVWTSVAGELQRMYIVQIDPSTTFLLWYQGNSETEREVIESIRFISTLPTP